MRIKVHIERVVLEGLPVSSHDAQRVQRALTAELERLIAAREISGDLRSGGAVPSVQGVELRLPTHTSPRELGRQIARSVHRGLASRR
jgi:hypothetical protein